MAAARAAIQAALPPGGPTPDAPVFIYSKGSLAGAQAYLDDATVQVWCGVPGVVWWRRQRLGRVASMHGCWSAPCSDRPPRFACCVPCLPAHARQVVERSHDVVAQQSHLAQQVDLLRQVRGAWEQARQGRLASMN